MEKDTLNLKDIRMEYDNCPKCSSNWIGELIPQDIAHNYVGTHWKREVGIDGGYLDIYDGIVAWRCPDCGQYSPRSNSKMCLSMFDKFMKIQGN